MNTTYTSVEIKFSDGQSLSFEDVHLSIGAAWIVVSWEEPKIDESMPACNREAHYPSATITSIIATIID